MNASANYIGSLLTVTALNRKKEPLFKCKMQQFLLTEDHDNLVLLLKHIDNQKGQKNTKQDEFWRQVRKFVLAFVNGFNDFTKLPNNSIRTEKFTQLKFKDDLPNLIRKVHPLLKDQVKRLKQLAKGMWLDDVDTGSHLYDLNLQD
jgi:hypothetical protein